MTQPPQPDDNGHVLAVAAVGLALIAVESRVRQDVDDAIAAAFKLIAAAAIVAASTAPAVVITGIALLAIPAFHSALTAALDTAKQRARASIQSGYTAAAQVAQAKATADLAPDGYDVPTKLPELDRSLDVILSDVDTMFGHAQTDIQAGVAAGYDNSKDDAQRIVDINTEVDASSKRLDNRAAAAASTAVQQGANDAQQAIYNEYQNSTGTPGLMKRWTVTSATPCQMCAELDGTMVGINAEFNHNTALGEKVYRPVWRNLLGPPRHPNCRCQLELVKT